MAKRYLLLAALSALMLGACSDDNSVNGEPDVPQMQPNTLPMNVLSASSQAGRITVASATRGLKSERLQRVATIAPVSDVGDHNWSATAVTVRGGNAYVTWHSDRQANNPAEIWGGAIDVINIPSEAAGPWEFSRTATNEELKFNHVYADGTNLYLAATSSKVGAVVGRVAMGDFSTVDYLDIPGSSANAVAASGTGLVAVSGYAGAAVSFPAAFDETTVPTVLQAEAVDFGGKYVEDGYILRTDDANAQLIRIGGATTTLEVALVSTPKVAESYNPTTGEWVSDGEETATHFGKHTMAINGGYVYIAAGMNGLRSYQLGSSSAAWSNKSYTTAVYADDNYVYAATDAGLRVYKKGENGALELFAFEVKEYDAAGKPTVPTAGTKGHSANFVAVGGGYIFVAYGQSGVYVFKLDENAEPAPEEKVNVGISIPDISWSESDEVEKDGEVTFTIPEGKPADIPDDKVFVGWSEDPENPDSPVYTEGDKITIPAGEEDSETVLKPVYADKLSFSITFDINEGTGNAPKDMIVTGYPAPLTSDLLPGDEDFSKENFSFLGWATTDDATEAQYAAGSTMQLSGNVTLYAVWGQNEYTYNYTVKFDIEDAQGTCPEDISVKGYTEDDCKITLPGQGDLVQEGYTFKGWATVDWEHQDAAKTPVYTGEYTVTGNVTLYPVWVANGSGGTSPGTGEVEG